MAIDSGRQAITLLATRHPAIELLFYLFKLRPDLDTLVVEHALEVPGILKIFRQKEMIEAGVKAVEIKKFSWFDERSEVLAKCLKECTTIERLSILTVNDYNKTLPILFTALPEITHLTHLHVALNVLANDTINKFITCIGRMYCIRVLDLSIVKSGPKPQVTKHKENYAVLIL